MDFGWALEEMKTNSKVTRKGWNNPHISVALQRPDENSKMTKPYIYMEKAGEVFPVDLSCESILATDWEYA